MNKGQPPHNNPRHQFESAGPNHYKGVTFFVGEGDKPIGYVGMTGACGGAGFHLVGGWVGLTAGLPPSNLGWSEAMM